MTKRWRRAQWSLRFPLGDPAHQQRPATARPSCRHNREIPRCTPSPPSRPTITIEPPTTTHSSIAPPLPRPPPHLHPQSESDCWVSPTPVLTPYLPVRPPVPLPLRPSLLLTIITTTITTTTTPITTTITLPLPLALPVSPPLTLRPTTPTPIAPAPPTPLWAPPPPHPTLLARRTPHLSGSRSLTQVPPLPKCSTDLSERPLRRLEQMQQG